MVDNVIPLRGKFENAKAFLHNIANDDIQEFVIITINKNGDIGRANFNMTRANMAYASILIAELSRE